MTDAPRSCFDRPAFTSRVVPVIVLKDAAQAVAEGRADFAGLDALTWALMQDQHDPAAARLKVIGQTAPTPALPFIAAPGADGPALRAALAAAIAAMPATDRATLHLCCLAEIPAAAYLAVPSPPSPAHFGLPD